MIRTDHVEVEVPVPHKESKWIKIGDEVLVYEKDYQNQKSGVVVRKADFIEPTTQSQSIFVKVKSTSNDPLLTGEYRVVDFPGHIISNAMEIPRNAVFNTNTVYSVVDGKLKKQEVNILKVTETTLIFNDLDEGLKVVVEPLINVKENMPVGIFGEEKIQNGAASGERQGKPQTN